jgi:hypothetical protein
MAQKSAPIAVPGLTTFSTDLAQLEERERSIKNRLAQNEIEYADLLHAPAAAPNVSRVSAILGDVDSAATAENSETRRVRLAELAQERTDLRQALDIIRGRIAAERRNASALAWQTLAPVHRDLVRDVCLPLAQARKALQALWAFRDDVNRQEIIWLAIEHFTGANIVGEPQEDRLGYLLSQAVAAGYLKAEEIN